MIIRPLAASDRDLIKNFYLAFSTEDRRKRFCCTVSDDAISDYVGGLNFTLHLVLGAFGDQAELVGVAELAPGAKAREMAFAVRQDVRSQHIGTRLLARILCHASMLGIRKVFVTFLADNMPMRRMAIRAGMQVQIVSCEAYARRDILPPSAEDVNQWAIDEALV
jgi:GNAT superfamily N-acetyltransferase